MAEQHRLRGTACGGGLSRRALLVAGGLAGGLTLSGCMSPSRPAITDVKGGAGEDPALKAYKEMLDRRAKAVLARDERTFLADLDPSNAALVKQQKMLFANLRQFKFKDFRYIVTPYSTKEENGRHEMPTTHEVSQLVADEGPEGVAPYESFLYRLVKKGDKYLINEIVGFAVKSAELFLGANGMFAWAAWNTTPLKVANSGNVWLAADDSVPDLNRYADVAAKEAEMLESMWGKRIRFPGHTLFLTRDDKNFGTWFMAGTEKLPKGIEGFERSIEGVRTNGQEYGGQYVASRIVVNLRNISKFGDIPHLVMRHELMHALSARASMVTAIAGITPPTWAVEGFARYTETIGEPQRMAGVRAEVRRGVATGKFTGKPPRSKTFYDEKHISFNYDLGATVFSFAERLKGREAAIELFAAAIQHPDLPLVDVPVFNAMCKDIFGIGSAAFLKQWAAFVRRGA